VRLNLSTILAEMVATNRKHAAVVQQCALHTCQTILAFNRDSRPSTVTVSLRSEGKGVYCSLHAMACAT